MLKLAGSNNSSAAACCLDNTSCGLSLNSDLPILTILTKMVVGYERPTQVVEFYECWQIVLATLRRH